MTVPAGLKPELAVYLQELEDRLAALENPRDPTAMFAIASASLSTTNAATYRNRSVYVSDLNMLAWSNGSHWYRADSGAQIV